MAPEYRIYVPPESTASFESDVNKIHGAEIISSKYVRRDMPITREDFTQEELASKVRTCIQSIPQDELLRNLTYWKASQTEKRRRLAIETPPPWMELMTSLKAKEKARVSFAIDALHHGLVSEGRIGVTLSDLRNLNWRKTLNFRLIGEKSVALLQRIFQPSQ